MGFAVNLHEPRLVEHRMIFQTRL